MNRDKHGRFAKITNKNSEKDQKRYKKIVDKLNDLVTTMTIVDSEINILQDAAEGELKGDTTNFRQLLNKQIELLELMLTGLDLVDEARKIKPKKEEPKHKCCSCEESPTPEEIFNILKPVLDELGISPEDIAQVGFIDICGEKSPPKKKKCCKKK